MSALWTLDDIPWEQFDPSLVDDDLIKIVRAASMVESNARVYARYLCNVFSDDPGFCRAALEWAEEEVQHGLALGQWARLADPTFQYDERFAAFCEGYQVPTDLQNSVRGSRTGELVARCMVEVGTSSYYTAIAEATDEPVLKEVCRRIATDEWRHYGLFYRNLRRYLEAEPLPRHRRAWIALTRALETEDDELAFAFHIANFPKKPYEHATAAREYSRLAFGLYRPHHIERAMAMILKAVGFPPNGRANRWLTRIVRWVFERRYNHGHSAPAPA